jgi:tRNA-2-methylthio-N6-dimethylallyladenosine synthase
MNRQYTRAHYLKLIRKIRKNMPGAAISTDVIVGFPGEIKKQFKKSAEVFKKAKFDMAYIAQYSPRPGTAAEKMLDNVSKTEKERREKELTKILIKTALENNKKYIGRIVPVLVESEKCDPDKSYYLGKTRTFKNVKFSGPSGLPAQAGLLGTFQHVKIIEAESWGLRGDLISRL